jgi:phosphoribosylaminoimidazole-succinocarboxamide synthase
VSDLEALDRRGLEALLAQGKVRDIYSYGSDLLMVTSDRMSTYDVVHPTPIPGKGAVLTGLSVFWFAKTSHICPNHLISYTDVPDSVRGRALLVKKLDMLPIECVVRGYLAGSAWKEYRETGAVSGIELGDGLLESQKLSEPIFTPSTKAQTGHDENVDLERAGEIVGDGGLLEQVKRISLELYEYASEHAAARGIILCDTKFEFGRDASGNLCLADEVLTPDSSRFWPADDYEIGKPQPSFDKQYVRDWAAESGWDKKPPAPELPNDVVDGTRSRYREAYERITSESLEHWLERSGASA